MVHEVQVVRGVHGVQVVGDVMQVVVPSLDYCVNFFDNCLLFLNDTHETWTAILLLQNQLVFVLHQHHLHLQTPFDQH